jgi:4-hydroxybenzoate polyprenyltransferase
MKCYKSKTMWFSVALVVFGALLEYLPYLQTIIDPKYYGLIFAAVGVITAILRYITKEPINP